MTEYKGIKRADHPRWSGWHYIDMYCKNKSPLILENDIVLIHKAKSFYFWKKFNIFFLNVSIWGGIAYGIYELTKG